MNDGKSRGGPTSGPMGGSNSESKRMLNAGFTIIETMIVLAITGMMLMSALYLIVGQQNKVQFTQAIQDVQSAIQQAMTEVGAGYYPNPGNLRCDGTSGIVNITTANNPQGSNTGCIFLGKVLQFGVQGSDPQEFIIHTVAGLQDNTGSLASARPRAIAQGQTTNTAASFPDASLKKHLLYGLHVVSMYYMQNGAKKAVGAVAFASGLGTYNQSSQLVSGTQQISMIPVDGSDTSPSGQFGTNTAEVVDAINNNLATSPVNPAGGVLICFQSGSTNQSGLVTIGSNGRGATVKLDIKSKKDCT